MYRYYVIISSPCSTEHRVPPEPTRIPLAACASSQAKRRGGFELKALLCPSTQSKSLKPGWFKLKALFMSFHTIKNFETRVVVLSSRGRACTFRPPSPPRSAPPRLFLRVRRTSRRGRTAPPRCPAARDVRGVQVNAA